MVQKAAKILNINLIFLRPHSPDLNPIEDVWRIIKKKQYIKLLMKLKKNYSVSLKVYTI